MPISKSKSIVIEVPAVRGTRTNKRTGHIINGTNNCLVVVSVRKGFTVNHVLSGCSIGSNDDNLFLSRKKATQWGKKFWSLMSPLAITIYQKESSPKILRTSTNEEAKTFAKKRTNSAQEK